MRAPVARSAARQALLGGALCIAVGCGGTEDPALRLVEDVVAAAEERDADAVIGHLAPSFRGEGGLDRAGAGAELRRYFGLYRSVDVTLSDVQVERGEGSASVTLRADFSGRPKDLPGLEGLLPDGAAFRFQIQAATEGGAWKVMRAEWKRIALP